MEEEIERIKKIKSIISKIPTCSGIYMMKDKENNIIYVGKAINLKRRVSQYFNKNLKSERILKMTTLVQNIEYIITENEVEALVLECNYIKNLHPKYNVMLRDDKTYPYIKINIASDYPTIFITRRKLEDKALYFGPYTSVKSIREVLSMIKQIFPVKRCKHNLEKKKVEPCLYYHIGRCLAPCKNDVNKQEYRAMIKQIVMFLNGNTSEIEREIKKEIEKCIERLEFEKAGELKERLISIEKVSEKQNVGNLNEVSTDVVGYINEDKKMYVEIFKIRGYRLKMHDKFVIDDVEEIDLKDTILSCISQYYNSSKDIPKKIYIKLEEDDRKLLDDMLSAKVIVPKIGDKMKLIKMAEDNIKINLTSKEKDNTKELKELLDLDFESIESYDISNLGSEYIVGAMIRVDKGKLNKDKYRKFKMKYVKSPNDPECIYEVVSRRLAHAEWELPDVMFIDGGITQTRAAHRAIVEKNLAISVYGMVKNDKHRTKGLIDVNGNEVEFKEESTLNFLTFVQDEVHRFVIAYHRKLRDEMRYRKG